MIYVIMAIGALIGGGVSIAVEKFVLQPIAITKAVDTARAQCVADVRAATSEALLAQFEAARQAETGIGPTPVDRAELQLLCNNEPLCRERGK